MRFRVRVNDEEPVVASAEGLNSLATLVAWHPERPLHLGLLGSAAERTRFTWIQDRALSPGDRVTVEILTDDIRVEATTPERKDDDEEAERVYYRIAKDAYLRLKAKYEPDETT